MNKSMFLTCHTDNCENKDIPVPSPITDTDYCACGPCGQTITDITYSEESYEVFLPAFHALCDARHGIPGSN